jgi:hypothetical protein
MDSGDENMSEDGTSLGKPLTPARLRAMAAWFREFAALASADQRVWQMQLAGHYERLAAEREAGESGAPR